MPQLEGPMTKIYSIQLFTRGLGEKKAGKRKRRLATVVSSGAKLYGKKKIPYIMGSIQCNQPSRR